MSDRKVKSARREERTRSLASDTSQSPSWYGRNKILALWTISIAALLVLLGYGGFAFWNHIHPAKPLHSFTAQERAAFIDVLKASGPPAESVWIACPDGKEDICGLVRQFVPMFRESGWQVLENRVVAWKPAHPLGGVHLILYATGESDDSTLANSIGIKNSFTALGIPVQTASAPDVPKNSIGIFFGPDL